MCRVKITPPVAAIAGASLGALAVAFINHSSQLAPHGAPELSFAREPVHDASVPRPQMKVYVAGAVVHPGVYAVSADERAQDALTKAGGATRDADLVAVNLAAHVADGDEIAVPRQGEVRAATSTRAAHTKTSSGAARRRQRPQRNGREPTSTASGTVDLNSADERTLAGLPGIGPTLAQRIVDFRTLNGPFASVDGLADVAGITPQRLDTLAPLLTAGR
jgi:competence protein ComEA